jgi:hypothetical protein
LPIAAPSFFEIKPDCFVIFSVTRGVIRVAMSGAGKE